MTRIIVDPMELVTASTTLQASSIESADIGADLPGCVRCPMPPAVRADVDQLVANLGTLLDVLAAQLHAEAVELAHRAVIAALDPLGALSGAPLPAMTTNYSGIGLVGGGGSVIYPTAAPDYSVFGMTSVGGGGSSVYPTATPDYTVFGMTSVGGGGSSVYPTATPDYSFFGMTSIGGGPSLQPASVPTSMLSGIVGPATNRTEDPLSQLIQDRIEAAQITINQGVRSSDPQVARAASAAQWGQGAPVNIMLAPTRRNLEDTYGPLSDSQVTALSPHTPLY